MRDAVHLTRAGDDPDPAGRLFRQWSRAVARPTSVGHLATVLDSAGPEQIALCLNATGSTPVERAANVLEAVLTDSPRTEVAALILADAVLNKAIGKDHLMPLLAVGTGAGQAVPLAADLLRRASRRRAVAPKLRAKAADMAVEMFLTHDALAPGALTLISDRAARRLCDRLVALGALRELTGRDSFRLYGL